MSDARPEVPPPRYEMRGDREYLIRDEQEWLARPAAWGLDHLPEDARGRKKTLFNYAYCSWLAELEPCPVCRPLIREMFAEERIRVPAALAPDSDDPSVRSRQIRARYDALHPAGRCDAAMLMRSCVRGYEAGHITESELFNKAFEHLCESLAHRARLEQTHRYGHESQDRTCALALELIGPNPFRPVAFAPEWRTGTAMALARNMYESRDFGAMPILADALQDAGCDSDDVLNHCRNPKQVHVRGCWVVDLVLEKA